jgi:lambda repressor-like predicted transcriptional regulator
MDATPTDIKIRLLKAGVTQAEIAKLAGVSSTAVWMVIYGKSVSDKVRRIIAKSVGAHPAELWPSAYFDRLPPRPGRPRIVVDEDKRKRLSNQRPVVVD